MNGEWNLMWLAFCIAFLFVLAIVLTPLMLIGIPAFAGAKLYLESDWRAERIAKRETDTLYSHAISGSAFLTDEEIEDALTAELPSTTPQPLVIQLLEIGRAIFEDEGLSPEIPPPPAIHNSVEAARYRDQLARIGQAKHDRVMQLEALGTISEVLAEIAKLAPPLSGDVLVDIKQFAHPLNDVVEVVIAPFFKESDYKHFKTLREQLNRNIEATHKTNPVLPSDFKGDDVVETYLKATRLYQLFQLRTPFSIPEVRRFEHMHMIAGSGHGKTQTLQYLIKHDLQDVMAGEKSIIVIDSQGDLINTILKAKHLPPEKIVLIDPEDLSFPVSLNLFSVGQDRLEDYSDLERERLTNSIIELYDYVLGSLLAAGMTAKQGVLFRYVTRLMFHIPDATIHTLRELLEPNGADQFQEHIAKLSGSARHFFEKEFNGKEFTATKSQVLRRLYGILENQTFERMFSNPESKFDMFEEMNAGKLILINTAKSLLKEDGTEIFGRFFIAMIAQAAQERATLPSNERMPAMVYVDEAQDYFDQNISIILSQARKYRVGMIMAHQYLGQLNNQLQEGFEANTAIKLAGGVSARDARSLAGQMSADPNLIQDQPKGTFATFIRGYTKQAVPISFPFFELESMERASEDDRKAIKAYSREHYAEPFNAPAANGEESHSPEDEDFGTAPPPNATHSNDESGSNITDDPTAFTDEL